MAGHTCYENPSLRALTDGALLFRLETLVAQERESTADIVEHLMEVERRELALDLAFPSLFVYCVKKLRYSRAMAFFRIRAARAAVKCPDILPRLRSGSLHLEAVVRLYPYLNSENSSELLERASGASKREVLALVAELQGEPVARRDLIVPVRRIDAEASPQETRAVEGAAFASPDTPPDGRIRIAPEVVPPPAHRFHFTADADLLAMVERLRGLLRHKIPDGRLENIFKEAAKALIERIERDRNPLPDKPKTNSPSGSWSGRVVPKAVKREVWARDEGRCTYAASDGRRCESRDALEYDHILPWADGGRSDAPDNIRLLCRAHNQRLGRRRFGPRRR